MGRVPRRVGGRSDQHQDRRQGPVADSRVPGQTVQGHPLQEVGQPAHHRHGRPLRHHGQGHDRLPDPVQARCADRPAQSDRTEHQTALLLGRVPGRRRGEPAERRAGRRHRPGTPHLRGGPGRPVPQCRVQTGHPQAGLRHPRGAARRYPAGAVPRRRHPAGRHDRPQEPARPPDQPHQDSVASRHCRAPPAPGRPPQGAHGEQGHRLPRQHGAQPSRREGRSAHPPARGRLRSRQHRLSPRRSQPPQDRPRRTLRADPRHRTHRRRQDDHLVRHAEILQQHRDQHLHHREPHRIPHRRHHPGADE